MRGGGYLIVFVGYQMGGNGSQTVLWITVKEIPTCWGVCQTKVESVLWISEQTSRRASSVQQERIKNMLFVVVNKASEKMHILPGCVILMF